MSTAKTVCKAGYMTVPQFTFVPYDIDKNFFGNAGHCCFLTIWAILTCGRFTVRILVTGRYANRFLNWRPDFV